MSTNIFLHEFRMRRTSVLTWSLAVTLLIAIFSAMFPVFGEQAELMNDLLANYPPELVAAFGMDRMDLSTVLGFYSLIFLFVQLCLAIQASN